MIAKTGGLLNVLSFVLLLWFLEGCAGHGILPITGQQPNANTTAFHSLPNLFESARGRSLSANDLDNFIDPTVVGADRVLARRLMSYMPPNWRGDFVFVYPSGRLMSNNPALVRYFKLTQSAGIGLAEKEMNRRLDPLAVVRNISPQNYSNVCSPPDPGTGGPYVRQVSQCAATAGFTFVNVACSSYYFAQTALGGQSDDQGNLYIEISNNNVGGRPLYEGGLQFNASGSIQPYVAESGLGYLSQNLTNPYANYACGRDIVIVSGVTWDAQNTFTMIGYVPTTCIPEYQFCAGQIFAPDNQTWMFFPSPFGSSPGYDAGMGENTPCIYCAVSRVTAIAQSAEQNSEGYLFDGSYFGVDPVSGNSVIHWMQTAYGHWESDCVPGFTLCTGHYPIDPSTNYGGPQPFPVCCTASFVSGIPGVGPYESYDGINMQVSGKSMKAGGAFAEPIPSLPCTLDTSGLCGSVYTEADNTGRCLLHGRPVTYRDYTLSKAITYRVYRGSYPRWAGSATHTTTWSAPQPLCKDSQQLISDTWSPYEPKVQFGDPNLP